MDRGCSIGTSEDDVAARAPYESAGFTVAPEVAGSSPVAPALLRLRLMALDGDHESLSIVARTACAAFRMGAVREPFGTFAPVACLVVTVHCFAVAPCARHRM